jgi:hypothetical protein
MVVKIYGDNFFYYCPHCATYTESRIALGRTCPICQKVRTIDYVGPIGKDNKVKSKMTKEQSAVTVNFEIDNGELETTIPLFSYGILRKKSFLQYLVDNFFLSAIETDSAMATGFIPYHSNGINFAVPVTEKSKSRNEKAPFVIKGTLIYFKGKAEDIVEMYKLIDVIESSYRREKIFVKDSTNRPIEAYIYVLPKSLQSNFNIHGRRFVLYPDTVLDKRYIFPTNMKKPDNNLNLVPLEQKVANESSKLITYENGLMPANDPVYKEFYGDD